MVKYNEVVSWIKINFLDVEVYNSWDGVKLKEGLEVDWNAQEGNASYVNYELDGESFKMIVVGDMPSEDTKILALLHELGHHTSDQSGSVIEKEFNAWKDCLHWMKHLNIELTKSMKITLWQWFSSYLNVWGSSIIITRWLEVNGLISSSSEGKSATTCNKLRVYNTKPVYGFERWKSKY